MLQREHSKVVKKEKGLNLHHTVGRWVFPGASIQLHSTEGHEDCSEEGDAVEYSDESDKDSVDEGVAVRLVGNTDAEDGSDEEEDSKGTDGGWEPKKVMAPKAQLLEIQDEIARRLKKTDNIPGRDGRS